MFSPQDYSYTIGHTSLEINLDNAEAVSVVLVLIKIGCFKKKQIWKLLGNKNIIGDGGGYPEGRSVPTGSSLLEPFA